MTDDEIEALAKKHIAPHADRLDAIMKNPVPYQQTEQFRRVKALIADVLSKLRAPVADEPITNEMIQAGAKAAREYFEENGGNSPVVIYKAMRAVALASAPVAGEPVAYAIHNIDLKGEVRVYGVMPWTGPECMQDDAGWGSRWAGNRPLVYGDAAPQPSEAVRDPAAERDTGKDRLSFHIWALVHGMDITPNDSCGYVSPLTQRAWIRWNPPERAALSEQPGAQRTGGSDE